MLLVPSLLYSPIYTLYNENGIIMLPLNINCQCMLWTMQFFNELFGCWFNELPFQAANWLSSYVALTHCDSHNENILVQNAIIPQKKCFLLVVPFCENVFMGTLVNIVNTLLSSRYCKILYIDVLTFSAIIISVQ